MHVNINPNRLLHIFNQNYPLIYPNIANISEKFLSQNIIITHFCYPNSTKILNRIVVTFNYIDTDAEQMCFLLNQEKMMLCPRD